MRSNFCLVALCRRKQPSDRPGLCNDAVSLVASGHECFAESLDNCELSGIKHIDNGGCECMRDGCRVHRLGCRGLHGLPAGAGPPIQRIVHRQHLGDHCHRLVWKPHHPDRDPVRSIQVRFYACRHDVDHQPQVLGEVSLATDQHHHLHPPPLPL
jgi:hypothetical protein